VALMRVSEGARRETGGPPLWPPRADAAALVL
jgi:hypothetical protein